LFAEIPVKAEPETMRAWENGIATPVTVAFARCAYTSSERGRRRQPCIAPPVPGRCRFVDWIASVPITFLEYAGEAEAANPSP
jgi:hypothetical protein